MGAGKVIKAGDGGFYHRVRKADMATLSCIEDLYTQAASEPVHDHARPYFKILLRGGLTEREQNRSIVHRALSVAFQPAGQPHSSHVHPEGLHYLKIHMTDAWLASARDSLEEPYQHYLKTASNFAHGPIVWLGVRLYEEWRRMDAASPLAIEGLMLEMLAEAVRCRSAEKKQCPLWLRDAEALIRAEFRSPLKLDYIADTARVHPVYLARAFRQHRHCTIGEFIRRLRIEHACQQMADTDLPLREIALASGFADQSHFSRAFKDKVGLTPGRFRDACSSSHHMPGKVSSKP